jgi:hypothetical protein
MMNILTLSDELLLQILSCLSPGQLLPLAATLNKRIFHIAYPLLGSFLHTRRNEKRLQTLFGIEPQANDTYSQYTSNNCPRYRDESEEMRVFGLDGWMECASSEDNLRYFSEVPDLDGSFAWLSK